MVFKDVKRQEVWCVHFEDMKLYKGEVLGEEDDRDVPWMYVRMDGDPITKIEYVIHKNVYYSEKAAEKALFKAKLAGDKRSSNGKDK